MSAALESQLGAAAPPDRISAGPLSRWLAVVTHLDPRYGGLSAAVPQLGRSVAAAGKDVSLAAFCAPGEQFYPAEYDEAHLSFWPTSRRRWIESASLRGRFRATVQAADALHVHGLWEMSTIAACRIARRAGKPYVLSAHGMLEPWALANKGLKKKIYAALLERSNVSEAACLHALTEAEARQYREFGAKGPIAVVPNAVQVPEHFSSDPFLDAFPELRGKRLILFLGRLHPKKGLHLLAEAWPQIAAEFPEAALVLAGPDSEGMRDRLQAKLGTETSQERVAFTGMLDDAMKWSAMAAAECFVLPSFSEGLSMSVLEAMGAGLPVVVTHACNLPEVAQCSAGWVIAPKPDELISALRTVLQQTPEQNAETGKQGAALVAGRYSPRRVAEQMAAVYDFVLTGIQPQALALDLGEGL